MVPFESETDEKEEIEILSARRVLYTAYFINLHFIIHYDKLYYKKDKRHQIQSVNYHLREELWKY